MKLIFLGPPGAGKGTQAEKLSKELAIPHISTGDIFRENIKNQTELGVKAKSFIDQGLLVPDEVTNNMVKNRLNKEDCSNGYILDGYPRTVNQADFLSVIQDIDKVINFTLSDEQIIKRISGRRTCKKCGAIFHIMWKKPKKQGICDNCGSQLVQRSDEMPETVKKRLDVYNQQTSPLINYYKKKDLLVNVDASPSIDEIFNNVLDFIKN
ncbi:adenylate kinase [Candidatus Woesearchaeota archaeon]|nr:adenylate kinase [Candidatus Woesearchaeota archaeon]